MDSVRRIEIPFEPSVSADLRACDRLLLNGTLLTARDAAHQRLCALLEQGEPLPVSLAGGVIYYVGPTPASPGRVIGSAGPTTSSRMDRFAPVLYGQGVRATIGKGYRCQAVRESLQRYGAVHLAALGGAGALLGQCVVKAEVLAFEELGPEAIRRLEVRDFPVTVAYDAHGGSAYERDGQQ